MKQIQALWEGMDPRRRIIALLGVAAIVASIYGISRVATTPSMALLYSGLDAPAAGQVVAALEAEGIPFEIRDSSIYVQQSGRDRLRMELAAKGLPAGGNQGYEILDGLSGFGTTSQMFDAAYWRAKEGELARTITGSPNVRAARVHLANPVSQPFSRETAGSASVTVTMARGALDASQARAIRYLVSTAVAGIPLDSVAVLDSSTGVVLAGAEDSLAKAGILAPGDRAETLRGNIQHLLEARVGPGRAIVEVNVDADMDHQTITERTIDPESRVAISSETEENKESAQGSASGVTVASNLPDKSATGGGDSSRSSSRSTERQNFDVSETRRERVVQPGQVRRVSVAVMVDGLTQTASDGTQSWVPRPPEEMDILRLLVQTAIGFDAERGDTVTLQSLQFTATPEQGALAERSGSGFLEAQGARLAQIGVLGVIVLALIFFVLRPMMNRKPVMALAELTGPREAVAEAPRQIGREVIDLPPQSATKIDRLREVIASRADESAAVLRSWIESPDFARDPKFATPKEPAGS